MRRDHAIRVVHQLERFENRRCTKRHRGGFFVRQVFFPRCSRAEEERAGAENKTKKIRARTRVIWVRLDKLKATQRCLGRPRLIYQLHRYPLKKLPTVIALGRGWFLIWDGHHRAASGALLGKNRIKCQEIRR